MAAELHGRKTVVGNAGDPQLRCKLRIVSNVVLVLKTVIAYRKFVHATAVDRPCVGDANLWTTHNLTFDGIDRLTGEWQERAAIIPVIPVSVIPSEGPPQLLLAGKNVVDLASALAI